MFPLLPALLLLLLNGPANFERMAEHGALPAALAAIQQRIEAPGVQSARVTKADHQALASLLTLGGDPQLTQALVRLLAVNVACEPVASPQPKSLEQHEESPGEPPPIQVGKPQSGFLESQRSRDGPVSR